MIVKHILGKDFEDAGYTVDELDEDRVLLLCGERLVERFNSHVTIVELQDTAKNDLYAQVLADLKAL